MRSACNIILIAAQELAPLFFAMNLNNKKILVTYGPTWVALDDMRVLSNRSCGEMGKRIIENLLKTGARVTALEGPVILPLTAHKNLKIKKFSFFSELEQLLRNELTANYDAVIHAAAVSDFKPVKKYRTKISSDKELKITLRPTTKLIKLIKKFLPQTTLIGFKLESTNQEAALKKAAIDSIKKNKCDYVVANSVKDGYQGFIFNQTGLKVASAKSKSTMSKAIVKILNKHFDQMNHKDLK